MGRKRPIDFEGPQAIVSLLSSFSTRYKELEVQGAETEGEMIKVEREQDQEPRRYIYLFHYLLWGFPFPFYEIRLT